MHATSGDGSHASIVYKLKLDMTQRGRKMIRALAELPFAVTSFPLRDTRNPASVGPQSIQVRSLGMHRGTISIAAKVLDAQVGRGTNLQIFLACCNDAMSNIHKVEVALMEKVHWQAGMESRHESRTMFTSKDVDLPGILRGKRDKHLVREQTRQGGISRDELRFLYQELESPRNKVTLKVPNECRDSYKGAVIQTSHYLQITTYTKSMVSSNPRVQVALQIGYPPNPSLSNMAEAFAVRIIEWTAWIRNPFGQVKRYGESTSVGNRPASPKEQKGQGT
jgi:hypothetical protein